MSAEEETNQDAEQIFRREQQKADAPKALKDLRAAQQAVLERETP